MDDPARQRELRLQWADRVHGALLREGVSRGQVADLARGTLARLHPALVAGRLLEVYELAADIASCRERATGHIHERDVVEALRQIKESVAA